MNEKKLEKIEKLLLKMEQELTSSILNSPADNDCDLEKSLQIMNDSLNLRGLLTSHSSQRKFCGPFLNKIRGKFYQEIDLHLSATLRAQEVFNLHALRAIKALQQAVSELGRQKNV